MQYCFCILQGLGALWLVQVPDNQRLYVFAVFPLAGGICVRSDQEGKREKAAMIKLRGQVLKSQFLEFFRILLTVV